MPETVHVIDYDQLALDELEKASAARTPEQQWAHLDRAAVLATLAEQQRAQRAAADDARPQD